jgi:hypothetical protein
MCGGIFDVYKLSNHRDNLSVSSLKKSKNLAQTETKAQGVSSFFASRNRGEPRNLGTTRANV